MLNKEPTMQVTRQQYRCARKLLRQNGAYALNWMQPQVRLCIASTLVQPPIDQLEQRVKATKILGGRNPKLTKSFLTQPFLREV